MLATVSPVVAAFVLATAGSQRIAERSPQVIEAGVRVLENAAHIGQLGRVEEQVCFLGVAVNAVMTFQQLEGHQRVQEIAGGSRVQPELFL